LKKTYFCGEKRKEDYPAQKRGRTMRKREFLFWVGGDVWSPLPNSREGKKDVSHRQKEKRLAMDVLSSEPGKGQYYFVEREAVTSR